MGTNNFNYKKKSNKKRKKKRNLKNVTKIKEMDIRKMCFWKRKALDKEPRYNH